MIDVTKMFFSSLFQRSKAQGLSLNMIIIAVIAIIVLVVIVIMLTGKTKIFGTATADCPSKGGSCESINLETGGCPPGRVRIFGTQCDDDKICCTALDSQG